MLTKLRKLQKGFTIIEVLIVLAIAALILLIVFLAVPALQRNSRNTQMRNDVATILGYVSDFEANHNGAVPTDVSVDSATGEVTMTDGAGTATVVGKIRGGVDVDKLATQPSEPNKISLAIGAKCLGDTVTGGSSSGRAVAAGFQVETASDSIGQCQEN